MSSTRINWQQPFVNTFKHFSIASDKNASKFGDVSSMMDTGIKSTVYKIYGSSPSSNYISMPKHIGQSLGLTGRYIYFLFKPIGSKYFAIHIDVATAEKVIIRVSFSNLYKEFKASSTWLQFPYVCQAPKGSVYEKTELFTKDLSGSAPPVTKWTVLCVDLASLMQQYSNRTYQSVRGFKLCACMLVKNVVTSDIMYELGVSYAESRLRTSSAGSQMVAFPRDLSFPCEKHQQWNDLYDHIIFPGTHNASSNRPSDSVGLPHIIGHKSSPTCNSSSMPAHAKQVFTQSNHTSAARASGQHSAINNMTKKSLMHLNAKRGEFNLPLVGVEDATSVRGDQDHIQFVSPDEYDKQNQQDIHLYPTLKNDKISRANEDMYSPSSSSQSSSAYCEDQDPSRLFEDSEPTRSNINFKTSLEPDPILQLSKIIGFGSRQIGGPPGSLQQTNNYTNIFKWSRDSQFVVYGCQAIVVAYHLASNAQNCFIGHSDRVSCLALSPDNKILASGQAGPYSLVRLWCFATRQCISIFRNHDHSLYLLEFSSCGNYLCGVGKDKQGKTLLVMWDVRNCFKSYESMKMTSGMESVARVVASAHTDIHVNRLAFVHFDSSRLITCGKENIRFWRLKNDSLRSCAVNITPYVNALTHPTGSLEFTDICMNARDDSNEHLAYACTNTGQIFMINMARMEVESVQCLEAELDKAKKQKKTGKGIPTGPGASSSSLRLNSLTVSDSFCATGSEDGFVRIWTLDFGQVSVEAEHEAALGLVRFSPDLEKIATATLNGNLGILDVKNKEYMTLARSHTDSILDLSIDIQSKFIATCSADYTLRVWDFETCRQLYDFSSPNECPTRLCFLNSSSIGSNTSAMFACGFDSGKIRVFDVGEAKLVHEIDSPHKQKGQITDLVYCSTYKRLIAGDSLNYLCLFDENFTLVRMLPNSIFSPGSLCQSPDGKSVAVVGPTGYLLSSFDSCNLNELLRINILTNSSTNVDLLDQQGPNETSNGGIYSKDLALKLCYAPPQEQNQLVCVTSSNRLLKFDGRNGRLVSSISRIHRSLTDSITVSSDGVFLATSGDNSIKIWDYQMRLEKNFQTFVGHSSPVNQIIFTNNNKQLISVGDSIIVWDFMAYTARSSELHHDTSKAPIQKTKKTNKFVKNSREINYYQEFRVLNDASFEQMRAKEMSRPQQCEADRRESNASQDLTSISLEYQPRAPPVANESIHIETIAAFDDSFLNEEFFSPVQAVKSVRNQTNSKFAHLPTFVSDQINPPTASKQVFADKKIVIENIIEPSLKIKEVQKEKNKSRSVKTSNPRDKASVVSKQHLGSPSGRCQLKLDSVIGYNGKHAMNNLIWNPDLEFFAYSIGTVICCENLKTGKQNLLHLDDGDDVTILAVRHDLSQLASSSFGTWSKQCQITVWNCDDYEMAVSLTLPDHVSSIRLLQYSTDDRFLFAVSECSKFFVWRTLDYELSISLDYSDHQVYDIAWNPFKCNQLAICGQKRLLALARIEEKGLNNNSLVIEDLETPVAIREMSNNQNYTSLSYGENNILYAATSSGLVTAWNLKTKLCFLNWQADLNEIDYMTTAKHKLVTGSNKGSLKLWDIRSIEQFKQTNTRSAKLDGLIIESEIQLNSAIKCAQFDPTLDIGIVSTTKNTLWYVNWTEESSVRLVSAHTDKINAICCIENKYLASVSHDGSLNIWSFSDRERIVQFEVKTPALCLSLIYCNESQMASISKLSSSVINPLVMVGYQDGSLRVFDIDKKNIVFKVTPSSSAVTAITHLRNSPVILIGYENGCVDVMDLLKRAVIKKMVDHKGSAITSMDSFRSSDNNQTYWLIASQDRKLSVWSGKSSETSIQLIDWITFPSRPELKFNSPPSLAKFECSANKLSQSGVENIIFVGQGLEKQIIVYNFIKKEIVRTVELDEMPECISFSNNKKVLAMGTRSRMLQIKDYQFSDSEDDYYTQHSDTVSSVCFSADDRKLISTAYNEIFIWTLKD